MSVRLGDLVSDFTANTTAGPLRLHGYLGDGWGVLFAHPADLTPVCTTEPGEFARREAFAARGYTTFKPCLRPSPQPNRWPTWSS
ncbi:MAG: redoxin domain-containing protein [Acidimicrobiaceae bacterium]|nr:redoxin domain-containing protein [Acidimicrobiaceae bacterium]